MKIAIIGTGNMGGAIAAGLAKGGIAFVMRYIRAASEEETDKVTTAGGITIKGKNDPEVGKVLIINIDIS